MGGSASSAIEPGSRWQVRQTWCKGAVNVGDKLTVVRILDVGDPEMLWLTGSRAGQKKRFALYEFHNWFEKCRDDDGALSAPGSSSSALPAVQEGSPGETGLPADTMPTAAEAALRPTALPMQTGTSDKPADGNACLICTAAPRTHAFYPCGHQCVCQACAGRVLSASSAAVCPICRTAVQGALKIFV
eukprot:TRINITY_DN64708_c0_g1_i1.p1 TRINITY_DN64708_c0_g1~~TRINITY_DN64708_c0_g1_i1.p1  ORF type:complete len:188 (-),score=7.73 TRINITY_DN64708_c0_g1_i1:42-605(-)